MFKLTFTVNVVRRTSTIRTQSWAFNKILETIGMKEVYRTPEYVVNDAGRTYTMQSVVYEFPSDYAGATPIR